MWSTQSRPSVASCSFLLHARSDTHVECSCTTRLSHSVPAVHSWTTPSAPPMAIRDAPVGAHPTFAAISSRLLTCQVFEGRLRSPMALAARTPSVSTRRARGAARRCTAGWWLPGTPLYPGVRHVRADHRVPPAGFLLVGGEVASSAAARASPGARSTAALRPVPGAAQQVRDLRDVLCPPPIAAILGHAGLPRVRASFLMASSSAAVIIQPQVNSRTSGAPRTSDSRCLMSSWLAPALSTRTMIFRRNRAGPAASPRSVLPYGR